MRLAVLGDIHHYRLIVPPWKLLGKRLLGQTNLWFNRRRCFNRTLLVAALKRILQIKPDLLLLSGDLTTTSLEAEFADVAALLEPVAARIPTLAVPGNHDRYTLTSALVHRMEHLLPSIVPQRFPHFQSLTDRWRLVALDGARPRLLSSRGELGSHQLRLIKDYLRNLTPQEGLVVLCHYPLKAPPRSLPITWDHKLADSHRLRRMLIRCPARLLYIHGHIHKPWCWQPKHSNQSHFTYINAGSPSMTNSKHPLGQGFWEIRLPPDPTTKLQAIHHIPTSNGHPAPATQAFDVAAWRAHRVL